MIQTNYSEAKKMLVAVDCIVFGFDEDRKLKLLLVNRDREPHKGKWSLMGGFVDPEKETEAAANEVLRKLTGLDEIYMEQLRAFTEVGRDTDTERVISIAYFAIINISNHDKKISKEYGAEWFPVNEMPSLIFDHDIMVEEAKRRLKTRAMTKPIGFKLLPKKFTIPQLKSLYDLILETDLDKRNFSRRILDLGVLKKLDEKEKNFSKKGAFYYEFDDDKYHELLDKGLSFVIK